MPRIIHGRDELTDLSEAPGATENGGTQATYGISKHKIIVEGVGRRMGSGGLPADKFFQSYAL